MVESDDAPRPPRGPLFVAATMASAVMIVAPGCGMVPKSKMEECHRVSQTLRADNDRLKDVALDLRTQNQDLSQRAVDDARQIASRAEANERLLKSIKAYQDDRDKLVTAYHALEQQVRMALHPYPAARPAQLKAFAASHPGWSFDEAKMILSAPPDRLFARGTDTPSDQGRASLKALGSELAGQGVDLLSMTIVGPPGASSVVQAGFSADADADDPRAGESSARFLVAARAAKVREILVKASGIDPGHVRIEPPPTDSPDLPDTTDPRFEIRLSRSPSIATKADAPPTAPAPE